MAHAVPADPVQYARYHNLVEGLCIASGLPKPRLYIVDDPAPNAFSTGRNPKHAAVAVTTGLLEKMNRVELEGVLAHELSHIRNYDILVMTLAVTMVGIIALLSDFFLRIMFWTGGRGGRDNDNSNNPLGIVFAILGFVLLIFAPIIADAHADRGQPQARVPRRRVGRAADALPARADLRAGEAEGRPHRRRTSRRRRPRTCGSRSRSTRSRTRARPSGTTCSTRTRRSTTGSTRSSRCDAKLGAMRFVLQEFRRARARSRARRRARGVWWRRQARRRPRPRPKKATPTPSAPAIAPLTGLPDPGGAASKRCAITVKIDNTECRPPEVRRRPGRRRVRRGRRGRDHAARGDLQLARSRPGRPGALGAQDRPEPRVADRRDLRVLGRRAVRDRRRSTPRRWCASTRRAPGR